MTRLWLKNKSLIFNCHITATPSISTKAGKRPVNKRSLMDQLIFLFYNMERIAKIYMKLNAAIRYFFL